MATCPECGGRGGGYDDAGNWYKCYKCGGTGQVDVRAGADRETKRLLGGQETGRPIG